MITVHHLENSRSQRILWLLEALELEYDIKRYPRDPQTQLAPAALRAVHPLGKSPVVTDGDVTVAESGAIIEYVMAHYSDGRLQPADDAAARREYTYWLHYAEGTMMHYLVMGLVLRRVDTAPMPFFIRPVAKGITGKIRSSYLGPNLERNVEFMNATLASRPWFSGPHLTAADIQMSFILEGLNVAMDLASEAPHLADCLARCHADPAYQRAIERGGPFQLGARIDTT